MKRSPTCPLETSSAAVRQRSASFRRLCVTASKVWMAPDRSAQMKARWPDVRQALLNSVRHM
jgi:hypothetical protein